jgi:glycerophosphoryl diester phosphodiesterase
MARPCGCAGECGCVIVGSSGASVSGTGTSRDPYRIQLASPITGTACTAIVACVGSHAGNGLRYDGTSGTLSARISADSGNSIIYGSDGGLYTTGGSGGGGSSGGVTVDSLPTFVIGGAYGAGYSIYPEGQIVAYEAGMDMALPLMHVPVRRSREGSPYACHYRTLSSYNTAITSAQRVDNNAMSTMSNIETQPGGASPNVNTGYFGCNMQPRMGIPTLYDILQATRNRCVLYLEIKDLGAAVGETADPRYTGTVMRAVISKLGAAKSVIVGAELGGAGNTADVDGLKNALADCRADGMVTAVHISSQVQANTYTPTVVAGAGHTWVMLTAALASTNPTLITDYKNAGLQVMLYGVARQYQYNLAKSLAVRGVLSQDPLYAGGVDNNFKYQSATSTWAWGQADYGRQAYLDDISFVRDTYRGYVSTANRISIDGLTHVPGQTDPDEHPSSYNVLMGEQVPVRDTGSVFNTYGTATNYDISVGFVWSRAMTDKTQWCSVFFGVPEDRPLYDNTGATSTTKGYAFMLRQNGNFILLRYDGVAYPGSGNPYQFIVANWATGWGTLVANTEYRVKVQVRTNGLILGREDGGGSATKTLVGDDYTKWRGQYFYLGRHIGNDSDVSTVTYSNLVLKVN